VEESQRILRAVKENLQEAQNQQKIYADRQRIECSFEVGDLVFLRLQPYRQSSLKRSGAEKLKPKFYGPYKVIRTSFTFLALKRQWDNRSTFQRSCHPWMRRVSWS
jgi:hypothetical protein